MSKKLAVCVPYRNREQHLKQFIPHMQEFLTRQGIEFKIFICHQADENVFNRGKVKNIAFDLARKEGYDYFAFHDIDLLPKDESCDYRYPETNPVHLAYDLDDYGFDIGYLETFGGVVMFTREQFEKVNGYYNEYWGWGAEDDDLFFRCKKAGYSIKHSKKIGRRIHASAHFNGKSSFIEIPKDGRIDKALSGDFSYSLLIKPCRDKNIPVYLARDEKSELVLSPLLSYGSELLFSATNAGSFEIAVHAEESEPDTTAWCLRESDKWTHVVVTVDRKKQEMRIYLNGEELHNGQSPKPISADSAEYSGDQLILGKLGSSFFNGEIAACALYSKVFEADEIPSAFDSVIPALDPEHEIFRFDFTADNQGMPTDLSGHGTASVLHDVQIRDVTIDEIELYELPERRKGSYSCLPHEREGIIEGGTFQKCDYAKNNEKTFVHDVKGGIIDTAREGLNNLSYTLVSTEQLDFNHTMYNIKC